MKKVIRRIERKFGCTEGYMAANVPSLTLFTGVGTIIISAILIGTGASIETFKPIFGLGVGLVCAGLCCTLPYCQHRNTSGNEGTDLEQPAPEATLRTSTQTVLPCPVSQAKTQVHQRSEAEDTLLSTKTRIDNPKGLKQ